MYRETNVEATKDYLSGAFPVLGMENKLKQIHNFLQNLKLNKYK
jgi:hypothetical protein